MADLSPSALPPVPSERVLQALCADPLGKALWQAAYHQALAEVLAEELEQLKKGTGE